MDEEQAYLFDLNGKPVHTLQPSAPSTSLGRWLH